MKLPAHVPLAVATRGDGVESVHYGSIAVMTADGERLCAVGDVDFPLFTRSTLKPFQALPFVAGGGPAHFGFPPAWIALMCGSHSGEPRHVAAVEGMLRRSACTTMQLQCGCHVPLFYAATGTPVPPELALSPAQHNCSGKHAGFLAWCRQHGAPTDTYLEPDHPLQAAVRVAVAETAGCDESALVRGTDGCSAPNYAVPLARLAHAYARLARPADDAANAGALNEIFAAMSTHPEMVSGEERADLLLARLAPGDWIAKGGADGMLAIAIRSRGIGIALKVGEGNRRALHVVVTAIIERLGLLPSGTEPPFARWHETEIMNYAGKHTGRLLPVFEIA